MAEIVLFHHVLGLTDGIRTLAERLREGEHAVHTPDLFDGRRFDTIEAGIAHAREIGFETVIARGRAAAEELPPALVYIGVSMGVLPAQCLAQTRAGAKGAILVAAAIPLGEFAPTWPAGVPLAIHGMDGDPEFVQAGDLDAAQQLTRVAPEAQLYLYPGTAHFFVDAGTADYDPEAFGLFLQRTETFLARL